MFKAQPGGMQHQAIAGFPAPVEPIPDDRASQPQGMSSMDPELMGSAGDRHKQHPRPCLLNRNRPPAGNSQLAMHRIIYLKGPVVDIQTERKPDLTLLTRHHSFQERMIRLFHRVTPKLPGEILVGIPGQCQNHQAGCVHIQTVNRRLRDAAGKHLPHPGRDAVLLVRSPARNRQNPPRLVDDHNGCVLINNIKINVFQTHATHSHRKA